MPVVLCISIFKSSLKHIIQCCVATHFSPLEEAPDYPVITLFYCHNCALSKINYLIVPLDRRCLFCTLWFLLYREQSVSKIWPLKKKVQNWVILTTQCCIYLRSAANLESPRPEETSNPTFLISVPHCRITKLSKCVQIFKPFIFYVADWLFSQFYTFKSFRHCECMHLLWKMCHFVNIRKSTQ